MNLKNVIFLGDHIEIMKTFPDNFLDMILTDLPYNITRNSWEQEINLDLLWKEYKRILKQNGVIALTASQPFTSNPTQKPISLFEYLIKTYTNEEDLILDSCAGSGTTAIACKNLNRNYILIEKELKYYDIIINRISKYEKN